MQDIYDILNNLIKDFIKKHIKDDTCLESAYELLLCVIDCNDYHLEPLNSILYLNSFIYLPYNTEYKEYYDYFSVNETFSDKDYFAVSSEINHNSSSFYSDYYFILRIKRNIYNSINKIDINKLYSFFKANEPDPIFYINKICLKLSNKDNNLINIITEISKTKYEGSICCGEILLTDKSINDKLIIKFKQSIDFSSVKNTRKLIEIAHNNLMLATNGHIIWGYAKKEVIDIDKYHSIKIKGENNWVFYKGSIPFAHYMSGKISNGNELQESFQNAFFNIFHKKNSDLTWTIIENALQQKHGTMLLFMENAEKESKRLSKSNILVEASDLITNEIIYNVSSIDGAIIMDTIGKIYSIGVILDGDMVEGIDTDASRGARYNSAVKYSYKKEGCLVIVISEDGYVNLISNGKKIY